MSLSFYLLQVNKVKSQLNLIGEGDVYPYCCNFDYCNSDMCTAMKLPKGNPACVTTMTNKVEQAKLIQQGIINNNQAEVIQQVSLLIKRAYYCEKCLFFTIIFMH